MNGRRAVLVGGMGVMALLVVWAAPLLVGTRTASRHAEPDMASGSADDRAVAFGLFLDSAPPAASLDRGVAIAEGLRLKYGIDTGNRLRDREEAAGRAQREVLDRLAFDESEIAAMATSLGYSLDPARCGSACGNIRNLAILELKKRALETYTFASTAPR